MLPLVALLLARAGAGIKRHLVGGAIEHGLVVPENILRAVAVMHVPIDDGDALGPVLLLRMAGGDGDCVEKAEAHRRFALGMMTRRAGGDKGVVGGPLKHRIHRRIRRADGIHDRLKTLRARHRVGVDAGEALFGDRGRDLGEEILRMRQQHRFLRPARRLDAGERGEILVVEGGEQRAQALRALGVAGRGEVFEVDGVGVEVGGHGGNIGEDGGKRNALSEFHSLKSLRGAIDASIFP